MVETWGSWRLKIIERYEMTYMTWINQQMRCHVLGMSKSEWILSGFGCESNAEAEGWGGASGCKSGARGCQKWIVYDGKSDQKVINMVPPFSENLHSLQLWLSNIPEKDENLIEPLWLEETASVEAYAHHKDATPTLYRTRLAVLQKLKS